MPDYQTGTQEHRRRWLKRLGAQRAEVRTPGGRERLRAIRNAAKPPQERGWTMKPTSRQLAIAGLVVLVVVLFAVTAEADGANRHQARQAICRVFGDHCQQALQVSACETGGTYSVWARNGQYLGLFQMGSYARGRYGHSQGAWGQARAAYRYFVESGRDWSPWSCKP